jgi:serine/threonine-protein kinase
MVPVVTTFSSQFKSTTQATRMLDPLSHYAYGVGGFVRVNRMAAVVEADDQGVAKATSVALRRPIATRGGASPSRGCIALKVQLATNFRYVHEPLGSEDVSIPYLGNEDLLALIKKRMIHSRGGSFLITGFRGVGKTTLVTRALEEISREEGPQSVLVSVSLSVARPMSIDQLLFAIVRRTFESLEAKGIFSRLAPDTQRSLLLAYMRTSLSFKETQSNSMERGSSVGIGGNLPASAGAAAMAFNALAPKLNLTNKRSSSLATEASFLAYSDTDVEHDVLRIVALLDLNHGSPKSVRNKIRNWLMGQRQSVAQRIRLVVVLDELDKLTSGDGGLGNVEVILNGLKNILTTPGVHFIFVGGPDLHDKVLRDSSRGNGLYESVFGWQLYVPCIWHAPESLLGRLMPQEFPANVDLANFLRFLDFKARGIPRRLLQEFNSYVVWEGESPTLSLADRDKARIEFYSGLEEVLTNFFGLEDRERLFPVPIDEDRSRLSAYYALDWILKSGGRQFAADEIASTTTTSELDPLFRMSSRALQRLLDHLVQAEILEDISRGGPQHAIFEDAPRAQAPLYQLSRRIGRKLFGFAFENERERADLDVSVSEINEVVRHSRVAAPASSHPTYFEDSIPPSSEYSPSAPGTTPSARLPMGIRALKNGRYELRNQVGMGGMGAVFAAHDTLLNRKVAVKLLHSTLASDENMRARFLREGRIAIRLAHPYLVETYEVLAEDDSLGIVMQYIEGPTMNDVMSEHAISPKEAARIGVNLLDALTYLHSEGVFRIDLKPSNIIMAKGSPIIVDLGLAKRVAAADPSADFAANDRRKEFDTITGVMVGTPTYMAPEQFQGSKTDIRTDIYSLGIILAELILGRPARPNDDMYTLMTDVMTKQLDLSQVDVSEPLKSVILQATAKEMTDRFATPAEMKDALMKCPEYWDSNTIIGPAP